MNGNNLALASELTNAALAFPDRVERELAACLTVKDGHKLVAAGEAMADFARRLKAPMGVINNLGYGVLLAKAGIGGMMPPGKPGRGKKNPKPGLGFSEVTLTAYRKLSDNKKKLPAYREAVASQDGLLEITQSGFLSFVGCGVITTRHGGGFFEWYTPSEYIEAAREVMGSIDLDPASIRHAQKVVKAGKFYDKSSNGLAHAWRGNVFLNPPFKMPLVAQFAAKLCRELEDKRVKQAILLTNNCTDTDWWQTAAREASAVCFTDGRISFYHDAGKGPSPTNGQSFCYFGKRAGLFRRAFEGFGLCMTAQKAKD